MAAMILERLGRSEEAKRLLARAETLEAEAVQWAD